MANVFVTCISTDWFSVDSYPHPSFFVFFKILFIYSTDRDHKQEERQAEREGEAGSLLSRALDAGLDPRTLRP